MQLLLEIAPEDVELLAEVARADRRLLNVLPDGETQAFWRVVARVYARGDQERPPEAVSLKLGCESRGTA